MSHDCDDFPDELLDQLKPSDVAELRLRANIARNIAEHRAACEEIDNWQMIANLSIIAAVGIGLLIVCVWR